MNLNPASLAASASPAPGIDAQVVSELKDTVATAREKASSFFQNFPSFLTKLLLAAAVLIVGLSVYHRLQRNFADLL